jgi:hypothetical protein
MFLDVPALTTGNASALGSKTKFERRELQSPSSSAIHLVT